MKMFMSSQNIHLHGRGLLERTYSGGEKSSWFFKELEGSSPCSQNHATGPNPIRQFNPFQALTAKALSKKCRSTHILWEGHL